MQIMEKLTYLTEKLPRGFDYAHEVANRLNDKGIAPSRGEVYTRTIVQNVVYGRSVDEKVKLEIVSLVAEKSGKQEQVQQHLKAIESLLN